MKSFLISALATRFKGRTFQDFHKAHPHDWLVWEAVSWTPPAKMGATVTTTLEEVMARSQKAASNALAFELDPASRTPGQLVVGRGPECEIQINDGTLSVKHLLLMRQPDGVWTVRDAGSKNGTSVNGVSLGAGRPVALESGQRIHAAKVALTFCGPPAMHKRITQAG